MFGKLEHSGRVEFNKLAGSAKAFGNKYAPMRKINNTVHQINQAALPILTGASILQPEFAPITGGIAAGLRGLDGVSGALRKINFADGNTNGQVPHKSRLEKQ